MQLIFLFFYLPTFSTPYMNHLLYLMFRCDFDVMESLEEFGEVNTAEVTKMNNVLSLDEQCSLP